MHLVTAETLCLFCTDAVLPSDCNVITKCGPHERCYVNSYVTSIGTIRYNLGCKDSQKCDNTILVGRREEPSGQNTLLSRDNSPHSLGDDVKRATGTLICGECCVGELCNSAGCGNTGFPAQRGPICYSCQEQNGTNDCNKLAVCGRDEVCMLVATQNPMTHAHRYQTKCEGKQRCEDEMGRRQTPSLSIFGRKRASNTGINCEVECCSEDLCNTKCTPRDTSVCTGFGALHIQSLDQYLTKNSTYRFPIVLPGNFGDYILYKSTARKFQPGLQRIYHTLSWINDYG
ncbi:uncharacterized protein LOC132748313 [Ruditapes philippinarum]|uniref:uncharacterized protein LOC132748313 n=1 Tax=Ruditapes philippinarum TaxID=129788 RepID=UPI00295C2862|nr:uncharacterized protein LOC132748313 [Ruditapes philippinarum]